MSHEDCDVDPINFIEKATPLHLAVQIEDPPMRAHIVESLLDAGADIKCVNCQYHPIVLTRLLSMKDKNGNTILDIVPTDDMEIRSLIRKSQAQASISRDDIADGKVQR